MATPLHPDIQSVRDPHLKAPPLLGSNLFCEVTSMGELGGDRQGSKMEKQDGNRSEVTWKVNYLQD